MRRFLITLLLLAASALAPSAHNSAATNVAVPPKVEIKYRVSLGSMKIGEGRDVFESDGRTYKIVSESNTAGLVAIYRLSIRRESQGEVVAAGLRPQLYEEQRNGKLKRRVNFDWNKKQATLFNGEDTHTVPLPDNTWDTTSFGYNFAFARPTRPDLAVNLTDGRRINDYHYAILGHETIDTELGKMNTMHVKKIQAPGDKRAFEVWLALDQYYLPVRIRYTEKDGTDFDSVVTEIRFPKN
ncbi:MAG TPA: DUF3108 domain-containing protein [Burkholderiales bacterium]|nr:DUF3108 domain-containing protein [Burkholderiales bacterium]